jgi:hypothetical protein
MLLSLWLATVLLTSILRTWLMSTSRSPRASALDLQYGSGATGGHPGPPSGSVASPTVVADNGTPPDLLPPPTCTTTTAGDKSLNYLSPVVGKTFSLRDGDTGNSGAASPAPAHAAEPVCLATQ